MSAMLAADDALPPQQEAQANDADKDAGETGDPNRPKLKLTGFVDVVYAHNFNRPADHANFFPGVGTSAKRDDEFAINLAELDLVVAPEPSASAFALGFGNATEIVHAAEVSGIATRPDVWRNVVQASASTRADTARGGACCSRPAIYPSHIGIEAFETKDNWNYTRSWLGELSPYYQTGLKLAYPLSERWSAQLHLLNGWQMIGDVNRGKSVGWQVAYGSDRFSASFNGIAGPELPDDDDDIRAWATSWPPARRRPRFSLGVSVDVAREEPAVGDGVRGRVSACTRASRPRTHARRWPCAASTTTTRTAPSRASPQTPEESSRPRCEHRPVRPPDLEAGGTLRQLQCLRVRERRAGAPTGRRSASDPVPAAASVRWPTF